MVINHALDPVLICFPLKIVQNIVVMTLFIKVSRDFCDTKDRNKELWGEN
jgi:hypothetical protein